VLSLLADRGLLKGKWIAIDATTLEANAAMRSIERRDTGQSYEEFFVGTGEGVGDRNPDPRRLSAVRPRSNLTARVSGIQSKENSRKKKMNRTAMFRNRSLSL
jgi:hypothetical protein